MHGPRVDYPVIGITMDGPPTDIQEFLRRVAAAIGRAKTGVAVDPEDWLDAASAAFQAADAPAPEMVWEAFAAIRTPGITSDSEFRRAWRAMCQRAHGVSHRAKVAADPDFDEPDIPV